MPTWWPSRSFLAGIALTSTFAANPLPTSVAALLIVPLLIDIVSRGLALRSLLRITPLTAVIYILVGAYLLAILFTPTRFAGDVLFGIVVSLGVVGIVIVADDGRSNQLINGFFVGIASTATLFASLGLAKYWLQLNGYIFEALINTCGVAYPQGSAFCGDYNLYGLYMLVGSIGLTVLVFRARSTNSAAFLQTALAVVVIAGTFAGSRRFMIVLPLIPMLWIAIAAWQEPLKKVLSFSILPLAVYGALYGGVFGPERSATSDKSVVIIERAIKDFFSKKSDLTATAIDTTQTSSIDWGLPVPPPTYELAPRSVSPRAMAESMGAEYGYGLGSRVERWKRAWTDIQENGYLLGSGLAYHEQFSCAFVACEFIDYPHAPLLSAWISFGVLGAILVAAFYGITAFNIFKAGRRGFLSGASIVALATLPYSFVSGDILFSIPHVVIGAMLAQEAARQVMNSSVRKEPHFVMPLEKMV